MKTTTPDLMQLWMALPESAEKVLHVMQDNGLGAFDVNDPVMKGIITFGGVYEMPFICVRLDLTTALPVAETVVTHFRHGAEWLTTITQGRRPSFLPSEAVKVPAASIQGGLPWTKESDEDRGPAN